MRKLALSFLLAPALALADPAPEPAAPIQLSPRQQLKQDWASFKSKQKTDRDAFKQQMLESRKTFEAGLAGRALSEQKTARRKFRADERAKWTAFDKDQKENREAFLKQAQGEHPGEAVSVSSTAAQPLPSR
jgi:hypothetical protein